MHFNANLLPGVKVKLCKTVERPQGKLHPELTPCIHMSDKKVARHQLRVGNINKLSLKEWDHHNNGKCRYKIQDGHKVLYKTIQYVQRTNSILSTPMGQPNQTANISCRLLSHTTYHTKAASSRYAQRFPNLDIQRARNESTCSKCFTQVLYWPNSVRCCEHSRKACQAI